MGHDVFISYSSKDKTIADAVCSVLEFEGIRCWIAPRDVKVGASYATEILAGINSARAMVLIFSANANVSQHIEREIERAAHRQIPIIPFRVEDIAPEKALEYFLSTPHWLDAFDPPLERHIHVLASQIKILLDSPHQDFRPEKLTRRDRVAGADPATESPKSSALSTKQRLPWIVGVSLVVSVGLLIGILSIRSGVGVSPNANRTPTPSPAIAPASVDQASATPALSSEPRLASAPQAATSPASVARQIRSFVHITDPSQLSFANEVRAKLSRATFEGTPIETPDTRFVAKGPSITELRCLKAADCAIADEVAADVALVLGSERVPVFDMHGSYENDTRIRVGNFELWLAPPPKG